MFDRLTPCRASLAAMIVMFAALAFADSGRAQEAGVVADDAPITERDIEQQSKFMEVAYETGYRRGHAQASGSCPDR